MKRLISVMLIAAALVVMTVAIGLSMAHRADEFTMYWFGLGGLLVTVGIGALQRRR